MTDALSPKIGRPTDYNQDIADDICEQTKGSSRGIEWLCRQNPHWPTRSQIYKWLAIHPEFAHKYKEAKAIQYDFMAEQLTEIADDLEDPKMAKIAELRMKARMWMVERCAARKYGSRSIHTVDADSFTDMKKAYDEVSAMIPEEVKDY